MHLVDFLALIHPAIAVVIVFPSIGMVVNYAWQTRQRRLQVSGESKATRIPLNVGKEHAKLGRWLTSAVVGATLIALGYSIFVKNVWENQVWAAHPLQVALLVLLFGATIAALVCLYQAKPAHWRGIFATLTGMGLVVLGLQDGVFRRNDEWYISHFYIGITAALLMVFSLAIMEDIYQDRSNRWRVVHTILNCIALLLFVGQGITGTRDLLDIPLSWQKPTIYNCDFVQKTCPSLPPASPR